MKREEVAGAGLVAATPVAAWWVVGDRSSRGFDDLDYIFRPLDLPLWVEMLAGAGAVAVVMASVFVLVEARLGRAQVATLAQLCVAGVILGAGWRAATAGVIGANIGGAMALLFGLPVATALVGGAVLHALIDSRRPGHG